MALLNAPRVRSQFKLIVTYFALSREGVDAWLKCTVLVIGLELLCLRLRSVNPKGNFPQSSWCLSRSIDQCWLIFAGTDRPLLDDSSLSRRAASGQKQPLMHDC